MIPKFYVVTRLLRDILRDIACNPFRILDTGKGDEAEPISIIRHIHIAVLIDNKGVVSNSIKKSVQVPSPVLVLFGDDKISKLRTELTVIVPYPYAEIANEFLEVVTVAVDIRKCKCTEPSPIIAQSNLTNSGTSAAKIVIKLCARLFKVTAGMPVAAVSVFFKGSEQVNNSILVAESRQSSVIHYSTESTV